MGYVRTQIYLEPADHRRLKLEAGKKDVSMASTGASRAIGMGRARAGICPGAGVRSGALIERLAL